jgi:hypothetical protein
MKIREYVDLLFMAFMAVFAVAIPFVLLMLIARLTGH